MNHNQGKRFYVVINLSIYAIWGHRQFLFAVRWHLLDTLYSVINDKKLRTGLFFIEKWQICPTLWQRLHHSSINKSKVLNETRPLQQNFYLTFIQVNRVDVLLVENASKIPET